MLITALQLLRWDNVTKAKTRVISKALASNSFNVPAAEHAEGLADKLPYVTVVDEGLPLKPYKMRSYPGQNRSENRAIFNFTAYPGKGK